MLSLYHSGTLLTGESDIFNTKLAEKVLSVKEDLENFTAEEEKLSRTEWLKTYGIRHTEDKKDQTIVLSHVAFLESMHDGKFAYSRNEMEELFTDMIECHEVLMDLVEREQLGDTFTSEYRKLRDKAVRTVYNAVKGEEAGFSVPAIRLVDRMQEEGLAVVDDKYEHRKAVHRRMPPEILKMIDRELAEKVPQYYGFGGESSAAPFSKQHPELYTFERKELCNILNFARALRRADSMMAAEERHFRCEMNVLRMEAKTEIRKRAKERGLEAGMDRLDKSLQREKETAEMLTENPRNNAGNSVTGPKRLNRWGEALKRYLEENGMYGKADMSPVLPANMRSSDPAVEWRKRYIFNLADGFRIEMMPVYEGDPAVRLIFHRPVFRGEDRNRHEHGRESVVKAEWKNPYDKAAKAQQLLTKLADALMETNARTENEFRLIDFTMPVSEEEAEKENGGAAKYEYHTGDQTDVDSKGVPKWPFTLTDALYPAPKQEDDYFRSVLRKTEPEHNTHEEYRDSR